MADDDLADGAERSSGRWPAPDDTKADGWLLALQLLMAAAVAVGVAAFWVYVCQRCWCARRLARATRPRATIRIVHKSSTIVEDLWTDLNRRSSEAAAGAVQASERRSAKWGSDEWTAPTFDRRFASPRAREKAGVTAAAAAASAAAATPIDARAPPPRCARRRRQGAAARRGRRRQRARRRRRRRRRRAGGRRAAARAQPERAARRRRDLDAGRAAAGAGARGAQARAAAHRAVHGAAPSGEHLSVTCSVWIKRGMHVSRAKPCRAFRAISPPTGRATAAPESATRAALRFTAFSTSPHTRTTGARESLWLTRWARGVITTKGGAARTSSDALPTRRAALSCTRHPDTGDGILRACADATAEPRQAYALSSRAT